MSFQKAFVEMRSMQLFILFGSCVIVESALAQQCGNPPGGFQYSERFYQAEAKFYQATSGTSAGISIIADDLPIRGSIDTHQQITNWETLTVDQARSYIQQEHSDRGAQIVAECGYRLCTIANSPGSMKEVAVSVLGEICSQAISPSEPGGVGTLSTSPTLATVIFLSNASQTRTLTVSNKVPGSVKVNVTVDQGSTNASYLTVNQTSFNLGPSNSKQVSVTIKRPVAGQSAAPSVTFTNDADPKMSAKVTFALYSDPSLLLPNPSIADGSLWPEARISLDIDNPSSPFRAEQLGPYKLPVSQGPQMCNPGGYNTCASASYSASVNVPASSSGHTSATMTMTARVGGQCGRDAAGGAGGVNPRWQSTLSLPGLPDRHAWQIKVSTDIRHFSDATGACTVSMGPTVDAVPVSSIASKTYTLPPGDYNFGLSCTGPNPYAGCAGHANGINEHYENEHYVVSLDATRAEKTGSVSLTGDEKKPHSFKLLSTQNQTNMNANH